MRFNKDVEYALICLTALSRERRLFSSRELSDKFHIPYGILSKILQRLSGNGVVVSLQGARGGYLLDRNPESVTLAEVISSIQGKKAVTACLNEEEQCHLIEDCNIKDAMHKVQSMWEKMINSMTLGDFKMMNKSNAGSINAY